MNLKKIQHYLQQYKTYLRNYRADQHLHLWESQRTFQENWTFETEDLAAVYDQSLQNSHTRRLWKRENYEPKRLMQLFLDMQPDFVRHMFHDLFNEDKEIGGRVDRFVFYCDELLQEYKINNPRSIENNHYHGDNYQIVSLYLAFRYPDQYTYYDQEGFVTLLQKLGSMDIPKINDFARFSKVMRTLYKMIAKEEEIMVLHQKRLRPEHYQGPSLLLVYDFYQAVNRSLE